jgi:chromate transport protein ChrA
MFCSNCGTKNKETASFCIKCGQSIEHEKAPLETHVHTQVAQSNNHPGAHSTNDPVYSGLILFGWITTVTQFNIFGGAISILSSIATLIISVILILSKSPFNKKNGKIILGIWIAVTSISFIVAFNNAQQSSSQTQQTQSSGYYQSN